MLVAAFLVATRHNSARRGIPERALLAVETLRAYTILNLAQFKSRMKELQYSDDGRLF